LPISLVHHGRDNVAANITGTISDDLLVFNVIVLIALQLFYKVTRGIGIRHNRALELTDTSLMSVASIKEHYIITIFFYHLMDLARFEVLATANNTVFVNLKLIIRVLEAH